jgi:uncharacterized protein (TIGR01244 family)
MKIKNIKPLIILLVSIYSLSPGLKAQDTNLKAGKAETLDNFRFLFRYENFYISGQPTLEELQWFKSQGVKKIISLRSERENTDFSESAYVEKANAVKLGLEFYSLPVEGNKDYTPEKLDALISQLNRDEKIVIHCQSAGRATDFFMAYLIKDRGYTVNEAIEVGKSLRFSLPLEKLLNAEISMEMKNSY